MIRKIIRIDEEKCNGCGLCAAACHEGAIDIVNGKAKLVREHFCDGLGDCLPACPTGAITFEEREAPAYNAEAVKARQKMEGSEKSAATKEAEMPGKMARNAPPCGCPGARFMQLHGADEETAAHGPVAASQPPSRLNQWPCQSKLLPPKAPFFDGAKLLIAADCAAYACASFHEDFMKGKITLIGCPKLDMVDYTEKLTAIIAENHIKSVTVVRMEVPCCGGLQRAAENALRQSGEFIPWQIVTLSRDGRVMD